MEKLLNDRVYLTIDNYRSSKVELRNDGDLINHFASLIYAHYKREIPFEKVKEIRKYIKSTSSRMSSFRGEILYILSLLLALDDDFDYKFIEEIYATMDLLKDEGFKDCGYLALTAFVIARYGKNKDKRKVTYKMKEVYVLLKEKYYNITGEDDYLVCALWALNDIEVDTIREFIDTIYDHMSEINIKSKNSIQGLTNAIMLNGSSGHMYRTIEFIIQLEKRGIKFEDQFLPLIGLLTNRDVRKTVSLIEEVTDKLIEEESEYEYYMDKGFRTVISLCIIFFANNFEERKYIDELLALGVYCFIKSKNKGMFAEALA